MPISRGPVEDRLAIRELVESYNDAVNAIDGDAWAENWTDDATWTLPGAGDLTGKGVFYPAWQSAMANFEFVGFFASAGRYTSTAIAPRARGISKNSCNKKTGSSG